MNKPVATYEIHLGNLSLNYCLRFPLLVKIEAYSEFDIVAICKRFDEWGEGTTPKEAVEDLKLDIIELYNDLNDIPNSKLGWTLCSIKKDMNSIIYKKDWSKVDMSLKRTLTAEEIKKGVQCPE